MDPDGGTEAVERLRQAGNGDGKMYIIPHAGHHGEYSIPYHAVVTSLYPLQCTLIIPKP